MSPGSEPERDDSGLPPVDIEVPDDARELDREVQAYHREVRAERRHQRRTRWHRTLGKDGIVLPLLACCLILALITGTLLTVFTATSGQNQTGLPGGTSSAPTGRQGSASGAGSGAASGRIPRIVGAGALPLGVIDVDGQPPPIPLADLRRAMLVVVPPRCACVSTLGWLADVAARVHAAAYVIYDKQTKAEVLRLYAQLDSQRQSALYVAEDTNRVLTSPASYPAGIQATQLTAILVDLDDSVHYAGGLSPGENPSQLIQWIIQ